MNKKIQIIIPMVLIDALVILILLSWFGNMVGNDMHSLICPDGIRWLFSSFINNVESAPWGNIILIMITISAVKESGMYLVVKGNWSLKQRRALIITSVICALILISVVCLTFIDEILLSPFGGFTNSPLQNGLWGLILVMIILASNLYGYLSGRFSDFFDVLQGNTIFLRKKSISFINIILIAELCSCIEFVGLLDSDDIIFIIVKYTLYLISII